ncbi:hypothetical protein GGR51DRAFT_519723 [Nemania sp. FL0031]|nr:hypothetical protein GGR51DRAFT_519723 [Nemania sp. FL0031]
MKFNILSTLIINIDNMEHLVDSSEESINTKIKYSNDAFEDQILESEASIIELPSHHQELFQLSTARNQDQDEKIRTIGVIANAPSTTVMTGLIREAWLKSETEIYQRGNTKPPVHNRELSRQISSQSLNNLAHNEADTSTVVTPMQLLDAIGVSPNATWRDLKRVVKQAIHFDAESQGKAQWLLKTPEFNSWMQDRRPSILLADGATIGHVLVVSPMSSLCAALVSGLDDESSRTITLSFIAGLHVGTDPTSRSLDGPQGMMRSLVVQLLCSSLLKPHLEFLTPESLEVYHNDDLKSLCNLFVRLVQQLPSGIDVFCIIDGISWYEQNPWKKGLLSVTGMFEYLMTQLDPRETAILKVLMTNHGTSTVVVWRVSEGKYRRFWRHATLAAGHIHPGPSITRPQNWNRGA